MKKVFLVCALFLAALAPLPASAALQVDVTQANPQPLPIAIPDMIAADPAQAAMGANIASVVRADLTRSGRGQPVAVRPQQCRQVAGQLLLDGLGELGWQAVGRFGPAHGLLSRRYDAAQAYAALERQRQCVEVARSQYVRVLGHSHE